MVLELEEPRKIVKVGKLRRPEYFAQYKRFSECGYFFFPF